MKIKNIRSALLILGSLLFTSAMLHVASAKASERPTTQPAANAEPAIEKINLTDFEKRRTEKDTIVLDVRTPKEFAAGHVPGAINIDWHSRGFATEVQKLDKSKTYLVHCLAGGRSAAATRKMDSLGFTHLLDFSGGWSAYEKAGKPVEK